MTPFWVSGMVGAVAKDLMKFDLGIVDNLNLWMFVLSIVFTNCSIGYWWWINDWRIESWGNWDVYIDILNKRERPRGGENKFLFRWWFCWLIDGGVIKIKILTEFEDNAGWRERCCSWRWIFFTAQKVREFWVYAREGQGTSTTVVLGTRWQLRVCNWFILVLKANCTLFSWAMSAFLIV